MMAKQFTIFIVSALLLTAVQTVPLNSADAQTCTELCSSCKGVASFADDRCECNIAENINEGAECVSRMKRQAEERGLDLLSCDLSKDQRSTRCTLGLKHKFGKNNIDQVAKYFMQDGPMTGNIFRAPPYTSMGKSSDCIGASRIITQPTETLRSDNSDCVGQPQQYVSSPNNRMDAQQIVSSPTPQHFSSVPQHIVSNPTPQQYVSNPAPQQYVSNPAPQQFVSNPAPQQFVSNPAPQQYVSSPNNDCVGASQIITQPKETMPAPKAINYEHSTPQVSSPKVSANDQAPAVGQAVPSLKVPTVGAVNPLHIVGLPSVTPTFLQILGKQLSQPMLGIPQALHTITQTPGISQLVSAPGHLLNSLADRLAGGRQAQSIDTMEGDKVDSPKDDYPNSADDDSSTVGSQNPSTNIPTFSYINPPVGSSFISLYNPTVGAPGPAHISYLNPTVGAPGPAHISYLNPTVGAPGPAHISYLNPTVGAPGPAHISYMNPIVGTSAPAHISYMNPTVGASAPAHISYMNPTVGASAPAHISYMNPTVGASAPAHISYINPNVGTPTPTHLYNIQSMPAYTSIPMLTNTMMSSYLSHMPTGTYIVGSSYGMPYYNTGAPSATFFDSATNVGDSSNNDFDQHVGQQRKYEEVPVSKPQKKICKKSNKEESKKLTRDIKAVSEPTVEETKAGESEKPSEIITETANKQAEQPTTELPKIDRTTTQSPALDRPAEQKAKVQRSAAEKIKVDKNKSEFIGKIKPIKEILKKSKGEKKPIEQKSDMKS